MTDKQIVRELAKEYMEYACSEQQQRANKRMKDTNDLKLVRPPVLIEELPWAELQKADDFLIPRSEDPRARNAETVLRSIIYRKKNFRTDQLMRPYWSVNISYSMSPLGLERRDTMLETMSHSFEDVLENEEALEVVKPPVLELHPEDDERNMNYYLDLFGDTMPVKLTSGDYCGFWAWDDISCLRGVEPIYEDMYERPEYLHRIMQIFVDRAKARMDFLEENRMVKADPVYLHATPGMVSGLSEEDGWKMTWYRGMAQCFSCVSPAMFKEFELDYIKDMAERCAYTYYGCCEPLDDRIEMLKSIKNLRKLGVSPWANIESCAEQIGKDYVYARKPNPALVAHRTDPEEVRRETERTVKACLKNGCPCEYSLKDISTVSGNPENLIVWADTVSRVLDEYYEEA